MKISLGLSVFFFMLFTRVYRDLPRLYHEVCVIHRGVPNLHFYRETSTGMFLNFRWDLNWEFVGFRLDSVGAAHTRNLSNPLCRDPTSSDWLDSWLTVGPGQLQASLSGWKPDWLEVCRPG